MQRRPRRQRAAGLALIRNRSRDHLVVIGAGTAGLVAASRRRIGSQGGIIGTTSAGRRLSQRRLRSLEGFNRRVSSPAAAHIRRAAEFGVDVSGEVTVDFAAVMQRMRRLRAEISARDSAARFRDNGVDVFLGQGDSPVGYDARSVGQTLNFKSRDRHR